jgi:predicted nucleic acid-binding protein
VILVDTSAWIEYDRATGSGADITLHGLISGGVEIAVTEPVMMEVVAGAKNDRAALALRRMLTSFEWISVEPFADFEGAAHLYRRCRASGVTPRGLTDCMIATIALRSGSKILSADDDFHRMAEVVPLVVLDV